MFSTQVRTTRSALGVFAVTLVAALVVVPAASAKSYKVNMSLYGPVNAKTALVKGNSSGSPFGRCTLSGKLVLPNALLVLRCKGGTVRLTSTSKSAALNDIKGTWRITGGTGKFRGISGSGTQTGQFSTSKFRYVGTVRF